MAIKELAESIKSGKTAVVFFGNDAELAHPEITKAIFQNYMQAENKNGRWLILNCAKTDFERDDYFELVKTDIFLYSAITRGPREDVEIVDYVRQNATWLSYETLYLYGLHQDLSSEILSSILTDAYDVYLKRNLSISFSEYITNSDTPYIKAFNTQLTEYFPGIQLLLDMNCNIEELLTFIKSKKINLNNMELELDFNI